MRAHDLVAAGRVIAAQLGHIIEKAEMAGLSNVATLLERARLGAERAARGASEPIDREDMATMSEFEETERFLEKVRAVRLAGDADALADMFNEDATFRINGLGQPAEGRAAIRDALHFLIVGYPFVEFRALSTLIDGDRIAMRSAIKIRHAATGKIVETETSDFVTLKDGKIASYIQYVDTSLAADLGKV